MNGASWTAVLRQDSALSVCTYVFFRIDSRGRMAQRETSSSWGSQLTNEVWGHQTMWANKYASGGETVRKP